MSDDDCESSYNLQTNPDHDDESNRFSGLTAPTTPVKAFDIFRHVLRGSKNKEVSPLCCIPYSRIRGICRSGVTRLSKLFDSSASNLGYSQGHSSSASLPIVMEFDHMEKDFVVGFLVNERSMAITEAINRYNAHTVWYGIVDGVHRHEALLMNMENDPVKWGVICGG